MEAIIVLASLSVIALGVVIWLLYHQQEQALGNHTEVVKSFEAIKGTINDLMAREEQLHSVLTSQIESTKAAIAQAHTEGFLRVEGEIQKNTSLTNERFNLVSTALAEGVSKVESEILNSARKIETETNERFNLVSTAFADGVSKVESGIMNSSKKIESEILSASNKIESLEKSLNEAVIL